MDCKGPETVDVGEGLRGRVSPRQPQVGPELSYYEWLLLGEEVLLTIF